MNPNNNEIIEAQCPACNHQFPVEGHLVGKTKTVVDEAAIKNALIAAEEQHNKKLQDVKSQLTESLHQEYRLRIQDQEAQLKEKDGRIKEQQNLELESRRKMREMKEKSENLELEIEKRMAPALEKAINDVEARIHEENRNKIEQMEKEKRDIKNKLEEANRVARDNVSQQHQGESSEEAIKDILKASFPMDVLEDVPTGQSGADLIQRVNDDRGKDCGSILIENKEVQSWSNSWVQKLKNDAETLGTDIAVLVTKKLPKGAKGFTKVDNVYIMQRHLVTPIIESLRYALQEVNFVKTANQDVGRKTDNLYKYLASPEFRMGLGNQCKVWTDLLFQLDREERTMKRLHNERRRLLTGAYNHSQNIYVGLKSIMGDQLPNVPQLELESLKLTYGKEKNNETDV